MKKKEEKQIKEPKKVIEPIFVSTFYWRELSEDGLLKDIKPVGPYYNESNLNCYGGFDSREQALKAWAEQVKQGNFLWENCVLIEQVGLENKEDFSKYR